MLHRDAIVEADHVRKLLDAERGFTIEMVKLLLQAVITGKVRG